MSLATPGGRTATAVASGASGEERLVPYVGSDVAPIPLREAEALWMSAPSAAEVVSSRYRRRRWRGGLILGGLAGMGIAWGMSTAISPEDRIDAPLPVTTIALAATAFLASQVGLFWWLLDAPSDDDVSAAREYNRWLLRRLALPETAGKLSANPRPTPENP